MSRCRLSLTLERDHARRIGELAVMKRKSRSAIVAAAIASYLSPEGVDRREAMLARRLAKLTSQFDRLQRDQAILIETVALYIRHHFAIAPAIPEAHQGAARAQGKLRFEQFIAQLGRHLQRGQSLVRDVFEDIAPPESPQESAHTNNATPAPEVAS